MVTVRILEGPLDSDSLQVIARLYGTIDSKYSDMLFCENLFNKNPMGPSIHAFAFADEMPVGHYCLIPLDVIADGKRMRSAKAEAFFVDANYRSYLVTENNRPQPVAVALSNALYDHAFEMGFDLIHLHCSTRLGALHKLLGFNEYLFHDVINHFFFRPDIALQNRIVLLRLLVLLLHTSIYWLAGALKVFLPSLKQKTIQVDNQSASDLQEYTWNVVRNSHDESWDEQRGIFNVKLPGIDHVAAKIFLPMNTRDFAEIVSWPTGQLSLLSEIHLLIEVLRKAKESNAVALRCSYYFLNRPERLRMISRMFAFLPQERTVGLYVRYRSSKPQVERPDNIDPYFYVGF